MVVVLFSGSGSSTPGGTVAVTVLSMRAFALGGTVPVIVNTADSPLARSTVVEMSPLPTAVAHDDPASAEQIQVKDSMTAGRLSVTSTSATSLGPLLVTVTV